MADLGLFTAPEDIQRARLIQEAQMTPNQRLYMMGAQAGQQLGKGVGSLFGVDVQDPAVARATKLRELGAKYGTTTAEALDKIAADLQQTDPQMAMQVAQKANDLRLSTAKVAAQQAQATKTMAEEEKITTANVREEQLRRQLAALPPEATDKDVENVVRQFGNPDRIFASIERKQKAEADREAKLQLEREKAERAAAEKQRDRDFKEQMAMLANAQRSALTSVQREMAQARLDELKAKQAERTDKKAAAQDAAVAHASKVITDVADTTSLVSGMTTGLVGKAQSYVPGTDAYNLNQRLLTIKANLGFDRLQQMRDASPTGGALGQVAVQELNALQATVGSLELGQSKEELLKNLNKIDFHYKNWIRATRGEAPMTEREAMPATPAATPATAPATGGWSIRPVNK